MVKCYYIENLGVSDITVDYYLNKNPEKLQLILSEGTFVDLCADNDPMPVVVTSESQYYLYEKGTCVDSVCEAYASTTSTTTICYCVEINNPSTTETGGYIYLNCYGAYINTTISPLDTLSICTSDTQITILPMSGANLTTTVIGYCIQNQCTPFPTTTLSTTSWYTTTTTTCGCYTLEWLITGGTATYTWANCSDQTTNSLTVGLLTGNLSGTANICSSITPIMSGNMNPGSTGYTFYTLNGNCGDPICLNPGATTSTTLLPTPTTTTTTLPCECKSYEWISNGSSNRKSITYLNCEDSVITKQLPGGSGSLCVREIISAVGVSLELLGCCCNCWKVTNLSRTQTISVTFKDCKDGSSRSFKISGGAQPNYKYICSLSEPTIDKPQLASVINTGPCSYNSQNNTYQCSVTTTSTTNTPDLVTTTTTARCTFWVWDNQGPLTIMDYINCSGILEQIYVDTNTSGYTCVLAGTTPTLSQNVGFTLINTYDRCVDAITTTTLPTTTTTTIPCYCYNHQIIYYNGGTFDYVSCGGTFVPSIRLPYPSYQREFCARTIYNNSSIAAYPVGCCCTCWRVTNLSKTETINVRYIDCKTGSIIRFRIVGGAEPNFRYVCSPIRPQSFTPHLTSVLSSGECSFDFNTNSFSCITTSTTLPN